VSQGAWSPAQDLAALLDTLTDELLAAPDHEMWVSLRAAGEDPKEAANFMRRLLADAETRAVVPPVTGLAAYPRRMTVSRMQ
jgi:hypothetical protein